VCHLHELPDIEPVDGTPGQLRAGYPRNGGQHIDGHGRFGLYSACRQLAGPAHDAGYADAALPRSTLTLAERAGLTAMPTVREPRSIVGGEEDQRALIEPILFKAL